MLIHYLNLPFTKTMRESMGASFYIIPGIFGGLGTLALLVSIFNYLSYTVNLFLSKEHECAIRKSINAGRWHLFFLFFTDVVSLFGAYAAVMLATKRR